MRRLALLAALAVSACAMPPPTDEQWVWLCPGGASFSVRFDDGYTAAFVSANGRDYRLPAKYAASGSRYTDGVVEFWEHSRGALLHGLSGGDLSDCELEED